jgi:alpha-tubulin suppressor-like RCC1 family protein
MLLALLLAFSCSRVAEVLTTTADPTSSPDAGGDAEAGAAGAGGEPSEATVGTLASSSLDAGKAQSCLTLRGALYCWGANQRGQLGLGDTGQRNLPTRVGLRGDWAEVTTGGDHDCARRADGSVFCFGANDIGQLGRSDIAESSVPIEVALPSGATRVVAEVNHVCTLTQDAALYCWGENLEGELGQDDAAPFARQLPPVEVGTDHDWIAVDTGEGGTCGVRGSGELYCWGRNTTSQLGLGDGTPVQLRAPMRVGTASYVAVQTGQDQTCGIQADGALYCWGGNDFGNLGTGDRLLRSVPTQIGDKQDWRAVSLDTFHACGVDAAQHLFCWGRNAEGQLGTGDTEDRLTPTQVQGEGFVQIAVGLFHTCALKADDSVWCTGANESGELGLGDTDRRNVFTQLAGF